MTYIHCPDCGAVREMDAARCPECGRCANCGHKLDEDTQICECEFPADEKLAKRIKRRYGIPDESVEEEKAKWQRRKKLEPVKLAARLLILILCIFLGTTTAWFLLVDVNPITQVMVGMLVVCLLIVLYWLVFLGMEKVLLFAIGIIKALGKK